MWYTRSTIVSPRATSPASTSEALARRSEAITVVPSSDVVRERRPGGRRSQMSAPMRTISLACMKRFSKIVSVITRRALRLRHQRHELRLHIRGKAGIFLGGHVGGHQLLAPRTRSRSAPCLDVDSGLAQLGKH